LVTEAGRKETTRVELKGSKERAMCIALAALQKKALDLVVLDMTGLVYYADYFVICTGTSTQHVDAIVHGIDKDLLEHKVCPKSIEGRRQARWVLMDYGDTVVHVFDTPSREYYELEKLWLDAPRVHVDDKAGAKD